MELVKTKRSVLIRLLFLFSLLMLVIRHLADFVVALSIGPCQSDEKFSQSVPALI